MFRWLYRIWYWRRRRQPSYLTADQIQELVVGTLDDLFSQDSFEEIAKRLRKEM